MAFLAARSIRVHPDGVSGGVVAEFNSSCAAERVKFGAVKVRTMGTKKRAPRLIFYIKPVDERSLIFSERLSGALPLLLWEGHRMRVLLWEGRRKARAMGIGI